MWGSKEVSRDFEAEGDIGTAIMGMLPLTIRYERPIPVKGTCVRVVSFCPLSSVP